VIVVGNLVAGGSGKTPLVIALVQRLQAEGFRPGVISRGYGRRGRGLELVKPDSDPQEVGDEPLLIAQACGVPVAVCAARRRAAEAAIAEGCDVIVSDDGLQHRALPRNIEIEVVDGQRGYGNGRLFPAGPLREPVGRAVDVRVVNGEAMPGLERAGDVPMQLELGLPLALHDAAPRHWNEFRDADCAAIAGIGNPQRFFDALHGQGLRPETRAFPDHHTYTPADLDFARGRALLMTDKDAIKCGAFAADNAFRVPVAAQLPESFFRAVLERLQSS
jgi:tetraacyldisaccharide 4'-kinase